MGDSKKSCQGGFVSWTKNEQRYITFPRKKDSAKCIFLVPDLEKMGLYILDLKYKIQEKRTSKCMFLSHWQTKNRGSKKNCQ